MSPRESSPTERHDKLTEAAKRYLSGEIDVETFEEIERQNLPDYRAAVSDLMHARARGSDTAQSSRVRLRWPVTFGRISQKLRRRYA
jgi:hypothetical protein